MVTYSTPASPSQVAAVWRKSWNQRIVHRRPQVDAHPIDRGFRHLPSCPRKTKRPCKEETGPPHMAFVGKNKPTTIYTASTGRFNSTGVVCGVVRRSMKSRRVTPPSQHSITICPV